MRCTALALAFVATSLILSAQQLIQTQPSVAAIIPDNDVVHVFTDRVDLDYDGEQGDGDLPAQWLIIDPGTLQPRSTYTFPWARITARHPALDAATGLMFVGVGDTVWAYTSRTQQRGSDPVYVGPNETLGYDARAAVLLITQRPSFTDPGTVVTLDLISKETSTQPTSVNPQITDFFRDDQGTITAVVLCEGTFGNADGSVVFYDATGSESLEVGDTPNHLAIDEEAGLMYVVMNGSHQIHVIDLTSRSIVDTWETGTTGFDGPRHIALSSSYAFVTSYSGVVHVFNRTDGTLVGSPTLLAKADPIAAVGSSIWVGHSFELGTYTPTGNVAIYPLSIVSVRESPTSSTPTAFMTSADQVRLPMFTGGKPLTMMDLQGALVAHQLMADSSAVLDVSAVPSGVYVVSDGTKHALLNIMR